MKSPEGRAKSNTVELEAVLRTINDFSEQLDRFKNNEILRRYLHLEKKYREELLSRITLQVEEHLPGKEFDFSDLSRAYQEGYHLFVGEQLGLLEEKTKGRLYDSLPETEKELARFLNRAQETYLKRKENPAFLEIYTELVHDPRILNSSELSDEDLDYFSEIRKALEKPLEKITQEYLEKREVSLNQLETHLKKAFKWGFLEELCLNYAEELDHCIKSYNPTYKVDAETLQDVRNKLNQIRPFTVDPQADSRKLKTEADFRQAIERKIKEYHPGTKIDTQLLYTALEADYFELVEGALFLLKKKNLEQLMDEQRISLENKAISLVHHLSGLKKRLAEEIASGQADTANFRDDLDILLGKYDSFYEQLFSDLNPVNILQQVALCGSPKQAYNYAGMLMAKLARQISDADTASELLKELNDTETNIFLQIIKGGKIRANLEDKRITYYPYASDSKPSAALQSIYTISTIERKEPIKLVEIRKIEVINLPGKGQYIRLPIETLYGEGEAGDITSTVTYHFLPGFEMDLKGAFAAFGLEREKNEQKPAEKEAEALAECPTELADQLAVYNHHKNVS